MLKVLIILMMRSVYLICCAGKMAVTVKTFVGLRIRSRLESSKLILVLPRMSLASKLDENYYTSMLVACRQLDTTIST